MGERQHLTVGWWSLTGIIVVGTVISLGLGFLVPSTSRAHSFVFTAFATYGIFFAAKGILRGQGFLTATERVASRATRTLALATMRREILRSVGHLVVLVLGVMSLNPPPWFGKFFVASMFMLVYVMNANSTLDDLLKRDVQQAQAEDTKAEAERLKKKRR